MIVSTVASPVSISANILRLVRPEVPAQTPYSSLTVSAWRRHSVNTGHTSQSLAALRTCLMLIVGWVSSSPK
jgi:hypothetical protein